MVLSSLGSARSLTVVFVVTACGPAPGAAKREVGEAAQVVAEADSASASAGASAVEPLESVIGGATRLAAGDLDGDGEHELVVVDDAKLSVVDLDGRARAQLSAPGGIQQLEITDLDGDGRAEILAAWGYGRAHREVAARASVLRLDGADLVEQLVAAPSTERAQFVALAARDTSGSEPGAGAQLLVGYFSSKYIVELADARHRPAGWELAPVATIRMASSVALGDLDHDGREDLVIGRVYGEQKGDDGDAFVLRPDGERVAIPIVGGVRSLAVVDLDGDGRMELLIGDGWNRDYGHVARARLTRAWWTGEGFETELLDPGEGQYTLWDIRAVELDGRGPAEILTRGNAELQLLTRGDGRWQGQSLAKGGCADLLALERADGLALLLACEQGGRVIPASTLAPT